MHFSQMSTALCQNSMPWGRFVKIFINLCILIQYLIFLCPIKTSAAEIKTIRIALMCDMSGPGAKLCKAAVDGAKAAVDAINSEDWAKERPIELVISDTAGPSAGLSIQMDDLLKRQGVVAIIDGTTTSSSTTGGNDNLSKYLLLTPQVPIIRTYYGDIAKYNTDESDANQIFRIAPDINTEIKALYQWISGDVNNLRPLTSNPNLEPQPAGTPARTAGLRLVTPVIPDSAQGKAILALMKAYSTEFGIKVTAAVTLNAKTQANDLAIQLKKTQKEGVSILAAFGIDPGLGPELVHAAGDAGVNLAVPATMLSDKMMRESKINSYLIIIAPPALINNGLQDSNPSKLATIRFRLALEEKIGLMSPQEILAAATCWDSVNLLATGIKKLQDPAKEGLRNALENLDAPYFGVMGTIKPSTTVHPGPLPESLVIATQKGNALVPIGTYSDLILRLSLP